MTKTTEKKGLDRRTFFRGLTGAAGAAVASVAIAQPAQADSETKDERTKARYKETEHVKAYYRTNKY